MDSARKSLIRRRLKKAINSKLLSLGFIGKWPEWSRKTPTRQHFIHILAWKYGGGYQISAGYTGRGSHVAAFPFVKPELWETIAENDVRFAHTLPDCRRNLKSGTGTDGFPLPNAAAADDDEKIDRWIADVTKRLEDLNEWLMTGIESKSISID